MEQKDKIQELIEYLQGSCKSMYEACADMEMDEDDLTIEQLQKIDEEIFRCARCGWWYEQPAEEIDGEWVCEDCKNE